MASVIVPFRGTDPKSRLDPLDRGARSTLAAAMLADVLEAAGAVGAVVVVAVETPPLPGGVTLVDDPRRGLGAAVRAALDAAADLSLPPPFLVVNADLPCATARDLLALAGAVPEGGLALVAAADGTTNALALSGERLFEPVYGPGSAARFAGLAECRRLDAPNLRDDVDTLADLARVARRTGSNTRRVLPSLRLGAAA
ncbi:MAG TPA: NTP transferase domain-containing protein [Gaiellaceae bacterium]|nr:NTP transferase domain-containing protein [Gaiellaceae bacterium]